MRRLVIFGAGGHAQELAWMIQWGNQLLACRDQQPAPAEGPSTGPWEVVAFVSDVAGEQGKILDGVPVVSLKRAAELAPGGEAVVGVAAPKAREVIARRLDDAGFSCPSIRHPDVFWSPSNRCGLGTVLQVASIVTVNVQLGAHVLVNGQLTIGHDAHVGDYSVICPGARVSGRVHIGRRVFIGAGASFREGSANRPLVIGDDAIIGANAFVNSDVAPGTVVAGVPARPLNQGQGSSPPGDLP